MNSSVSSFSSASVRHDTLFRHTGSLLRWPLSERRRLRGKNHHVRNFCLLSMSIGLQRRLLSESYVLDGSMTKSTLFSSRLEYFSCPYASVFADPVNYKFGRYFQFNGSSLVTLSCPRSLGYNFMRMSCDSDVSCPP